MNDTSHRLRGRALLALILLLAAPLASAFIGDAWRTVRGDTSAGASWQSLTATATGRLIGVGSGGYLTVSDDGGLTWEDRRLIVAGRAEDIRLSDIAEFGVGGSSVQRRLAAVGVWLEERDGTRSRFTAKTYLYLSDDDGETWSKHPFPIDEVTGTPFGTFEGIALGRLFVTAGGELLAYGTTTVTNDLVVVWSIGGLVYRSADGIAWDRSTFELGPLYEMAGVQDGARVVAAGSSTVTDSADGAGWNGYLMRDANISLAGQGMDLATRNRLRIEDVIWHAGIYIAEAATYVPYDASGTIETSTTDRLFTLSSGAPFGGTRAWNAYEQPRRYGKLLSAGANLVRVGLGGVYQGSGQNWSWVSWDPVASNNALTKRGGEYIGIGADGSSSSATAVWKSTDGVGWNKVFTAEESADLYLALGRAAGTLFACGYTDFQGITVLWASTDNGATWSERAQLHGCTGRIVERGTRLLIAIPSGVAISDDGGVTWQERSIVPDPDYPASVVMLANNGRLVLGAVGDGAGRGGHFYVSDDGGETWSMRVTTTQFDDRVADIALMPSGRLIAMDQYNAPFYPVLMISDDNGDTWRADTQLQTLPGLIPIAGNAHQGIAMRRFVRVGNRVFLQGDESIVSTDDNGATWTTRVSTFYTNGVHGGAFWAGLGGLAAIGNRLVAPATVRDPASNLDANAVLLSDDHGTSWHLNPVPTHYATFSGIIAGYDTRAVVLGTRGAVLLSDGEAESAAPVERLHVRAGDAIVVPVPHPPLTTAVSVRYSAVADVDAPTGSSAAADTDYVPAGGVLTWAAGETGAKSVTLQSLDAGDPSAPDKWLDLQLVTEGDIGGTAQIPLTILNSRRPAGAGVLIVDADRLVRYGGDPAHFGIALAREPTANVTLTIENPESTVATVAPATLTFTAANWNLSQAVTITPTATAGYASGGSAHVLTITVASADPLYQALTPYYASYSLDANFLWHNGFD